MTNKIAKNENRKLSYRNEMLLDLSIVLADMLLLLPFIVRNAHQQEKRYESVHAVEWSSVERFVRRSWHHNQENDLIDHMTTKVTLDFLVFSLRVVKMTRTWTTFRSLRLKVSLYGLRYCRVKQDLMFFLFFSDLVDFTSPRIIIKLRRILVSFPYAFSFPNCRIELGPAPKGHVEDPVGGTLL